jgi:predicted GNAT family acetyltransferase
VGASSGKVGQIQGVWVHPERRGAGLATPATAAVTALVRSGGRMPSLYVNDYNTAARRVYQRVGFAQVATFATVLLH